jgi:multidrug efflux pump subunit AcrA (membrane-fusion protein)
MGMNGAVSSSSNTVSSSTSGSADFPREGNYVTQGQMLFRLVNTSRLWVEFNAPSTTAAFLKKGAKINWMNGEERIESSIDFIQPFFKEGENFIKIRSYVSNRNLSIGQLVEANVQTVSKESLWVPESVLLSMGNEQVVFIKQRGSLVPKVVTTGARAVDHVEVTSGITSGDEIALHAAYLIDSENFIKTSH